LRGLSTREETSALKAVIEPQATNAAHESPSPLSTQLLPEKPVVIIEPSRTGAGLGLRDLWAYRELLVFLAWRDLKVRYKQTVLGVLWVLLQPLLMTVIFTVFIGFLVRVPTGGRPYALLVYIGLLPWTFFSSAVLQSGTSIVSNAHLITKVYFPRLIIPAAAVTARLVDFAISFVILAGLMIYYRAGLTAQIAMLPVLILMVALLALGFGMLVSALNVKYRDIGVMLPVVLQLWMFVSPVVYPLALVPEKWRVVYSLNPMVGIISGFRSAILGDAFDWPALAVSAAVAVVLPIYSAYLFRRVERGFADII
jgi:lipopolysaccharide transport system permease protein